jgi:hypothetical protein
LLALLDVGGTLVMAGAPSEPLIVPVGVSAQQFREHRHHRVRDLVPVIVFDLTCSLA